MSEWTCVYCGQENPNGDRIACLRTRRHYIGIEKHEPYFLKAQERIDKERAQVRLFGSRDGGVFA